MLLVAAPAFAQQRPAPAPSPLRGYLIGGGGASMGSTAQTAVTLSAEIAENMSSAATNQLALVGSSLTALTGTPWVFEGRDKARSFTFGAKVLVPGTSSVHPYVGGGFGALNVRRVIHEQSRGNITQAFLAQFGSPDGFINPRDTDTTHPMGEVAAGVGAVIKRAYVDVGYRYRKAFHTTNQSFEISQVGAQVGVKF